MKKLLPFLAVLCLPFIGFGQAVNCTLTNATGCQCENTSLSACDLLPDMTVSWWAILNYSGGPNEYPQTGAGTNYANQGPDDGRLRLSGSTPNIGVGPLEVRGVDRNGYRWFQCGSEIDSLLDPTAAMQFTCPNGNPNPHQKVVQRVYHKNGNTMTYTENLTGFMTYHPTHGHYHIDDWEILTLRLQTSDPNPLNWPIVGTGHKIGFCLEDFGDCSGNNGHCRDSANNILINSDFNNHNADGTYSCSPVVQGIGPGFTDIYYEGLDNQWITIPPNTCNGNYYLVIVVDPHNYFQESNETNNVAAVPFTLTQQLPAGTAAPVYITTDRSPVLCSNESVTLTATAGTAFAWSNGATTQSITVPASQAGSFTCQVTNYCGVATTAPTTVSLAPIPASPVTTSDTVCVSGSAHLTATAPGVINWYDANHNYVATGSTYTTPVITTSTTYYAENIETHLDTLFGTPYDNEMGGGAYSTASHYLKFNANSDFTLLSTLVYSNAAGSRTITLQDSMGTVLQTATVTIPTGPSRVTLNFTVPTGNNYRLACALPNNLYRNSSAGVGFPYGVSGVCTITGDDQGAAYYHYFYDWQVASTNTTCASPQTTTIAIVDACTGLGENVLFHQSINVFPNPSNGSFNLSFNAAKESNIQINVLDAVGKVVVSQDVKNFQGKYNGVIDATDLAKGVYQLSVRYDGKPYMTKLVIQ